MYKVYAVEGGYQVFYCPSAPLHFNDCVPYDNKTHSFKQAAHLKCKRLNERLEAQRKQGKPANKRIIEAVRRRDNANMKIV